MLALKDILVVSLEQAVAAPFCSNRLAQAGARVLKIERAEGDFARGYDDVVHGESAYFIWLNQGKVRGFGPAEEVVTAYLKEVQAAAVDQITDFGIDGRA